MSLVCSEHGEYFKTVDEVFAVTTESSPNYDAVCAAAIRMIPSELLSRIPLEGGLDIHLAYSVPNGLPGYGENLSIFALSFGDYKYSVSAETARKYLPKSSEKYLPE